LLLTGRRWPSPKIREKIQRLLDIDNFDDVFKIIK